MIVGEHGGDASASPRHVETSPEKSRSHYTAELVEPGRIHIVDLCNDFGGMSVTNNAENVIKEVDTGLIPIRGKVVTYTDTEGQIDELIHDGSEFTGFRSWPQGGKGGSPANYIVTWAIDVDATSHYEAAQKALEIHRDPNSIATVFNVSDGKGSGVKRIDLSTPREASHE